MGILINALNKSATNGAQAIGEVFTSVKYIAEAGSALAATAKARAVAYQLASESEGQDLAILTRKIAMAKRLVELQSESEALFGVSDPNDIYGLSLVDLASRYKANPPTIKAKSKVMLQPD